MVAPDRNRAGFERQLVFGGLLMQLMRFSRTHNGADGFGFYLIPLAVYRFVSSGMLVASAIRPRW